MSRSGEQGGAFFDAEDESAESETYAIRPPEPESREAAEPASPPQPRRRTHKRRRHSESAGPIGDSPVEVPPAPWQQDRSGDGDPDWVADSGWRDPPLISAVWYPFTGNGWKVVTVYTLILWCAVVFRGSILSTLLGLGPMILISVLLLETANYTLEQIPAPPQFPEFSWSTISVGLMGLVAYVISGIPLMLGLVVMVKGGGVNPYVQMLLLAAGMLYVPMAFVVLAGRQNESALNPLVVFRCMRKMFKPYLLLCGIAAAAFIAPLYVLLLADVHPLLLDLAMAFLLVHVLTSLIRAVALAARKRGLTFGEDVQTKDGKARG